MDIHQEEDYPGLEIALNVLRQTVSYQDEEGETRRTFRVTLSPTCKIQTSIPLPPKPSKPTHVKDADARPIKLFYRLIVLLVVLDATPVILHGALWQPMLVLQNQPISSEAPLVLINRCARRGRRS